MLHGFSLPQNQIVRKQLKIGLKARKAKRGGLGDFPHERSLQETVGGVSSLEVIEQEAEVLNPSIN